MRIEPLVSEEALRARIGSLVDALYRDFADSQLTVLCIATGARRFVADLDAGLRARNLRPAHTEVRVHRSDGTELGPVQIGSLDAEALRDRDVLIVDDIVDEGLTLQAVIELVETTCEVRTIRTAVLVDKRERRRVDVPLDYVGFRVERGWVIGYGMDLDGAHRELDWIGVAVDDRF